MDTVVDSKYNSYQKYLIADILNANLDRYQLFKVIEINGHYVNKVSISGLILKIYESTKFYRIKVDDSTGGINVTLWKELIFRPQKTTKHQRKSIINESIYGISGDMCEKEIDEESVLVGKRMNDKFFNKNIVIIPIEGDIVNIRGIIKSYRNLIEISAVSCERVTDSYDEFSGMIRPIIFAKNCYQLEMPELSDDEKENEHIILNHLHKTSCNIKELRLNTEFLKIVYEKLVYLAYKGGLFREPIEAYAIKNALIYQKDIRFKDFTQKDVLDALKELELRGLVYSCNDFHFLPIE